MKRMNQVFAMFATAALCAAPALAQSGSTQQPGQRQQPSQQQQQDRTQAQAETARGTLVSVKAEDKTFTIRDSAGKTQEYKWNDDTKVTGSQRGVAGLATMSGEEVTIHYKMQGMDRLATDIAVQSASARPNEPSTPGARPGQPNTPGSPAPGSPNPNTPGR
jgi:hypothetical protein